MKHLPLPSYERLNELFTYDSTTGYLLRKISSGRARKGQKAGSLDRHGYLKVSVDNTVYAAHRLIWCLYYKTDPGSRFIDHVNENKSDNKISNLRLADNIENGCNRKKTVKNTTGFKGVFFDRGKYRSKIKFKGKQYFLGSFDTAEEAFDAYVSKGRELHGSFFKV